MYETNKPELAPVPKISSIHSDVSTEHQLVTDIESPRRLHGLHECRRAVKLTIDTNFLDRIASTSSIARCGPDVARSVCVYVLGTTVIPAKTADGRHLANTTERTVPCGDANK